MSGILRDKQRGGRLTNGDSEASDFIMAYSIASILKAETGMSGNVIIAKNIGTVLEAGAEL